MSEVATTRWRDWRQALSPDEVNALLEQRDWRSWLSIASNWGIVAGAFALVAAWPNPLTVVLALFVIGARQLGLAVMMHEASHRTLFRSRKWNDRLANWLCAYPIWSDLKPYRPYHIQHHLTTWTERDPDLGLATPFPVTRASLRRKIWRDLSGQTGWKRARVTFLRDLGWSQGRVRRLDGAGWRRLRGPLLTNAILLGMLALVGRPELYLLWVGAWLTTYSLVMRIRSIAEHSMSPDPANPLLNSRTTDTRWWERLLLAPNGVNYHLEHHLLMTVPHYHLPRMHRLLRERGILDDALVAQGYLQVLRQASSKAAA
ncbi:MAG: fatty acid desaturase family protein [Myxococcota bacterium]